MVDEGRVTLCQHMQQTMEILQMSLSIATRESSGRSMIKMSTIVLRMTMGIVLTSNTGRGIRRERGPSGRKWWVHWWVWLMKKSLVLLEAGVSSSLFTGVVDVLSGSSRSAADAVDRDVGWVDFIWLNVLRKCRGG